MFIVKRFEYHHTVTFEETNVVGNVYFSNYVKWQGACREHFLLEKAPQVMTDMENGLALVTLSCSCNYVGELHAFDKVMIVMYLVSIVQNKLKLKFEYFRGVDIVAQGTHELGFFMRKEDRLYPTHIPEYIASELSYYTPAE
jgi:enediyne biosynthesis thioesterase